MPTARLKTLARHWAPLALTLVALGASAWLVWRAFLPSDEDLARRLEALFETRTGQALVIGGLRWRLLGRPVVEVRDAHTRQDEAIRVRRLALYPQLLPLLRQRLVIDRLEIDGAEVPRDALRALRGGAADSGDRIVLRRLVFKDFSYTSYAGIPVEYAGEVRFDDDGLPGRLWIERPGVAPAVALEATRQGRDGAADTYRIHLDAAGGTAHGQARLTPLDDGRLRLTGELAPRGVEVQALLEAFHRRAFISGHASGETTLHAEGETLGALPRSLRTRSALRVDGGRILRLDVDKAVKTLGKAHAGQTPLDSLSGVVQTENTEHGMKTRFTEVKAVAGSYSATGEATLYRKRLSAEGKLDVAGGLVGLPFSAQGPTHQPELRIAKGAVAGAAIGTVLLPGIGTAIGAQIGGALSGPPKPEEPKAPRRGTRPRR